MKFMILVEFLTVFMTNRYWNTSSNVCPGQGTLYSKKPFMKAMTQLNSAHRIFPPSVMGAEMIIRNDPPPYLEVFGLLTTRRDCIAERRFIVGLYGTRDHLCIFVLVHEMLCNCNVALFSTILYSRGYRQISIRSGVMWSLPNVFGIRPAQVSSL